MAGPQSIADMLTSQKIPNASFDGRPAPTGKGIPIGTFYEGRVVREELSQQTKMPDKVGADPVPEFWDEAKTQPKMQIVAVVENPLYASEENPDGKLRIFFAGGALVALQKAAKEQGFDSILHGYVRLTWVGEEPPSQPGMNPRKTFHVDFAPGAAPAQVALMQGNQGQAATAPQPQLPGFAAPQQVAQQFAPPAAQQPVFQQPPVQQQFIPGQQLPPGAVAQQGDPAAWLPQGAPAGFPPAAAQAPVFQAPGQPAVPGGAAAVQQIMGAVEITPLDPVTAEQVRQVYNVGIKDAEQIVIAFAQNGIQVTKPQVEQALGIV